MTMLLTDAEIAALTGRRRRDAQRRALHYMGIEHRVRPDGSLAVLSAHVESVLSGGAASSRTRTTEPDWSRIGA